MQGLQLMLDHRGGLHTLDSSPVLRLMLYWYEIYVFSETRLKYNRADVNGSYFQDITPRFPPPTHLLPTFGKQDQHLTSHKSNAPSAIEESSSFWQEIRNLQNLLHIEMRHRDIWRDTTFHGLYILPILGRVLAMRTKVVDETGGTETIGDVFRLATVLYVSAVRKRFGVDTLSGERLYASKLRSTLASQPLVCKLPPPVLAWILSIAFTSNCDTEQKRFFLEALKDLTVTLEIASIAGLKETIKTVVWDEDLLFHESQSLQAVFMLDSSIGHII
jgi:hypothetical protein